MESAFIDAFKALYLWLGVRSVLVLIFFTKMGIL